MFITKRFIIKVTCTHMHGEPGMRWDGKSPVGKYLRPHPQVDLCLERRHVSFHCHCLLVPRQTHQCHVFLSTSVNRTVMNTLTFLLLPQQTTTHDFTCSVSEFVSSTGSIHMFPYVNSPDSMNKSGVSTRVYHEIMIFLRDDTYQ